MPDDVKPASPLPLPLKAVGGEIYGAGSFLVARVTAGPGGTSVNSEHDRAKARAREIVAACNAYPDLRNRVAALEAENAKLREATDTATLVLREIATLDQEARPQPDREGVYNWQWRSMRQEDLARDFLNPAPKEHQ